MWEKNVLVGRKDMHDKMLKHFCMKKKIYGRIKTATSLSRDDASICIVFPRRIPIETFFLFDHLFKEKSTFDFDNESKINLTERKNSYSIFMATFIRDVSKCECHIVNCKRI